MAKQALAALCLVAAASAGAGPQPSERLQLALRGVHFVPNHGQWADPVHYGFKSRGMDIAFGESILTMHLSRPAEQPSPVVRAPDPLPSPDRVARDSVAGSPAEKGWAGAGGAGFQPALSGGFRPVSPGDADLAPSRMA
jgi:hypothetical protein